MAYYTTAHHPDIGVVEAHTITTEAAARSKVKLMERTHGPAYFYRIVEVTGGDSETTRLVYEN